VISLADRAEPIAVGVFWEPAGSIPVSILAAMASPDRSAARVADAAYERKKPNRNMGQGAPDGALAMNAKLCAPSRAYLNSYVAVALPKDRPSALAYATAFVEEAKASGLVRRVLDSFDMQTSVIPPIGTKP